ncbi:MAG TPA: hypothetical protein ACQGQH_05110 [Xylella sp.]
MRVKQINKELKDGFSSCNIRQLTEAELEWIGGGAPREFFCQLLNKFERDHGHENNESQQCLKKFRR